MADRLARLDELYDHASRRAGPGMVPLLAAMRRQVAEAMGLLLDVARHGQSDSQVSVLGHTAAAFERMHFRLDLVPHQAAPAEIEWFLTDLLGPGEATRIPPPVVTGLGPQVREALIDDGALCALQLPMAERDNPLGWTLLAAGLAHWQDGHLHLHERLIRSDTLQDPRLKDWLLVRLSDMMAVRMVGPAYAFACHYAEPEWWFGPTGMPLPTRLLRMRWLLGDLAAAGFVHAQLDDMARQLDELEQVLPAQAATIPEGFAEHAAAAVQRLGSLALTPPYTPADFATAEALVADLRQGLPISAVPRRPQAEQMAAFQAFREKEGWQSGSAADLLGMLADRPASAATILNAGWLFRNELRSAWLDEMMAADGVDGALKLQRARCAHFDQLLQKSLETATLHRLMQETP